MKKQLKELLKGKKRIAMAFTGYILLTALFPNATIAQYTLDEQVSFLYINGTSTLHDWIATAGNMKGSLEAKAQANHIMKISSTKITIPVSSLKSGKEAMDKNMYKALKSENHPEITYQLKGNTVHNGSITVKGELTVSGVTKMVETKVTQVEVGQHIKLDGEINLKMSDFNIKPPEFLLGVFNTGDEISITFHFMFCKKN